MRSSKRLRTLGAALALAATLVAVNASQATAATWTPANTTVTGSAGNQVQFTFPAGGWIRCNVGITGKTISYQINAAGANGGVTFSGCVSGPISWFVTASATNGMAVAATSTSTAQVAFQNGNLKLQYGGCQVTVSPAVGLLVMPASWSNATRVLGISTQAPYTTNGSLNCFGPGSSGQVGVSANWTFSPLLSLV